MDDLFLVKIAYESLKGHWNTANYLFPIFDRVIASKSYVASWDEEEFFCNSIEKKVEMQADAMKPVNQGDSNYQQ